MFYCKERIVLRKIWLDKKSKQAIIHELDFPLVESTTKYFHTSKHFCIFALMYFSFCHIQLYSRRISPRTQASSCFYG